MKINRVSKWFGGITHDERSSVIGAALNVEEIDIFSNPSYMEPTTIFGNESVSSPLASITRSGTTATATSTDVHALTTGDSVTISGCTGTGAAQYNITAVVTVTNKTVFTYTMLSDPGASASGTPVATYSTLKKVLGYTVDDSDTGYALTSATDGTTLIYKLTTASADDPGSWVFLYNSVSTAHGNGNIIWHKWDDGTSYVYYPTVSGSTVTLRKLLISGPTESSVGTLTGLDGTGDRIPMQRLNGELFIGNGKYVSNVDDDGILAEKAFTIALSTGWEVVSFDPVGDELMLLCRSTEASKNVSKIFFWDKTATTGSDDEVTIPMGGPQIVVNHSEVVRIVCAKNGVLKVYELLGKLPQETHRLSSIATETSAQAIIPEQTKFIKDGILYFGLWKTDKAGLYAIGQAGTQSPVALILAKRFDTSTYTTHKPQAAIAFGPNFYLSFDDNSTSDVKRIEGNNSPTRSSNAVYESILIDAGNPEAVKEWSGILLIAKPIPASCTITFDCRTDNASSYDSNATQTLTNANDQTHDGTSGTTDGADTFWYRTLTSVMGRVLQFKISFTSNTTSKAQLYSTGILSDENKII